MDIDFSDVSENVKYIWEMLESGDWSERQEDNAINDLSESEYQEYISICEQWKKQKGLKNV